MHMTATGQRTKCLITVPWLETVAKSGQMTSLSFPRNDSSQSYRSGDSLICSNMDIARIHSFVLIQREEVSCPIKQLNLDFPNNSFGFLRVPCPPLLSAALWSL